MSSSSAFRKWRAESLQKVHANSRKPSTSVRKTFLESTTPRPSTTTASLAIEGSSLGPSRRNLRVETAESGSGDRYEMSGRKRDGYVACLGALPNKRSAGLRTHAFGRPLPLILVIQICGCLTAGAVSRKVLPRSCSGRSVFFREPWKLPPKLLPPTTGVLHEWRAGQCVRSIPEGARPRRKGWNIPGSFLELFVCRGNRHFWQSSYDSWQVANLSDVAVCMDGYVPEFQNWLQGGEEGLEGVGLGGKGLLDYV